MMNFLKRGRGHFLCCCFCGCCCLIGRFFDDLASSPEMTVLYLKFVVEGMRNQSFPLCRKFTESNQVGRRTDDLVQNRRRTYGQSTTRILFLKAGRLSTACGQ